MDENGEGGGQWPAVNHDSVNSRRAGEPEASKTDEADQCCTLLPTATKRSV